MYRVLGGDGRPYGPVTVDQLRIWLAEGRINGQTLTQLDGTVEWKPLALFPELGGVVPPPAPPLPRLPAQRKSKVAAGLLGILVGPWGVHRFYLGYVGIGVLQIFVTILTCGIGGLWGFIEGILIISGSTITTDADGTPLQD